jgi:hypothetical protein
VQVVNVERDVAAVAEGRGSELIYSGLTGVAQVPATADKKAAAAATAHAVSKAAAASKHSPDQSGLKPFDGATFAPSSLPRAASAATPGGAVARLLEKLKLSAPAVAVAASSDEEEEGEEIVMRVTVGAADGDAEDGSVSGSEGDDDADVVQSSAMGTVGGWGSAALSEKDKLTASRAAAPPAASLAAAPHVAAAAAAAAAAGDSSDDSSDDDAESGDEDGSCARVLDTSAGIPEGMSKAEWKKKVKEEKREKRKTKIPVRACCCLSVFVSCVQCSCCVSDCLRRNI